MRDTIEMAREAGAIHIHGKPNEFAIVGNYSIKAFEALIRADEQAEHEADKVIIEYHEATIKRLEATFDLALEVMQINLTLLEKINPYKGQEDLLSDSLGLTHKAITAIRARGNT